MPINGSELIDNPMTTIFSPFTDLLGAGFWLLPLTFIAIALYIKTKDVVITSMFIIASGVFLSAGAIFSGAYAPMASAFMLFAGIGIVGVILGIFFMRK